MLSKTLLFLCLILGASMVSALETKQFRLGSVSPNDKKFIYPTEGNEFIPLGDSVNSNYKDIITIEPRLSFMRYHDEKCISPVRGLFDNHDEIYWFCANADPKAAGTVVMGKPEKPGHRSPVTFSALPSKDDFALLVSLTEKDKVLVVAKTATAGEYEIYEQTKGKLAGKIVCGSETQYHDATKLRAMIPAKGANKPEEVYFFFERVKGATKIFKFKLDKDTSNAEVIEFKDLKGDTFKSTTELMHFTAS